MQIGKPGRAQTHICQADSDRVEVRGHDLCSEIMGHMGFTAYFHLLLTGRAPTPLQIEFLDLLLISIAEHGMMPTNIAARMTLAADPGSLHGAVAAGILGCGPVILGTAELCAGVLAAAQARVSAGEDPRAVTLAMVRDVHVSGGRMPGFGHPVHRPLDPRAERILELAEQRHAAGAHVRLAHLFRAAVAEVWGKPLTMNVSMPIAAVLLDVGFPPGLVKSIPILARTASLLAHLAEERENPVGFHMAAHAEESVTYTRAGDA